jgi:hypothetical protein
MAQQIINIGANANDGTGEQLRSAFNAVNQNFTEIYTAGPVGSNVVIANNTITVNGVNSNIIIAANGIGIIQANSSVIPNIDAVHDLGSPTKRFDTVYGAYFVGNGSGLTGVTSTPSPNLVNGTSNVQVTTGGNVTINIQNTSNTAVFSRFATTLAGNLLPAADNVYDLGSPTARWNDGYFGGNSLYLNTASITSNATAVTITNEAGGTFVIQGTGQVGGNTITNGTSNVSIPTTDGNVNIGVAGATRVVVSTAGMSVTGQVTTGGNLFAFGNVSGTYVLGNGAFLTGLPAQYSNANVQIFGIIHWLPSRVDSLLHYLIAKSMATPMFWVQLV